MNKDTIPERSEHDVILNAREASEIAGVKPALLKLWLATGQFETATSSMTPGMAGSVIEYYFTQEDLDRLVAFAKKQTPRIDSTEESKTELEFIDDGKQENFTVTEIASLWRLSRDTIQRLFQDEPGVVVLGDKNPKGKRRRVTLRIPRAVMERVKKRRSNS